ncbi:hypothetical protein C8R45DRAFT_1224154 [Mycena sanguinolenta]|nr:hypothetical protein C8R45DRAFT_1224154 [Mycena sanguinolenta]
MPIYSNSQAENYTTDLLASSSSGICTRVLLSHIQRPERARRELPALRPGRSVAGRPNPNAAGDARALYSTCQSPALTENYDALAAHATRRRRACDSHVGDTLSQVLHTANWVSDIACARLQSGRRRPINYLVHAAPFVLNFTLSLALAPCTRRINATSPSMRRRLASRSRCTIPTDLDALARNHGTSPRSQLTKIHSHRIRTFPVPAPVVPFPVPIDRFLLVAEMLRGTQARTSVCCSADLQNDVDLHNLASSTAYARRRQRAEQGRTRARSLATRKVSPTARKLSLAREREGGCQPARRLAARSRAARRLVRGGRLPARAKDI